MVASIYRITFHYGLGGTVWINARGWSDIPDGWRRSERFARSQHLFVGWCLTAADDRERQRLGGRFDLAFAWQGYAEFRLQHRDRTGGFRGDPGTLSRGRSGLFGRGPDHVGV